MKKTVAFLLTAIIALGMCGCGRISSDKIDDLIDEGYVIEQVDNNSICIIEDGVEYYYKTGLLKPVLSRVCFHVCAKPEYDVSKELDVTITPEYFRINIIASDTVTSQFANGNEHTWEESYRFEFKNDFSPENLTNNRGFADIAGDYEWFTKYYMTPEELQEIYDRALELEKEL